MAELELPWLTDEFLPVPLTPTLDYETENPLALPVQMALIPAGNALAPENFVDALWFTDSSSLPVMYGARARCGPSGATPTPMIVVLPNVRYEIYTRVFDAAETVVRQQGYVTFRQGTGGLVPGGPSTAVVTLTGDVVGVSSDDVTVVALQTIPLDITALADGRVVAYDAGSDTFVLVDQTSGGPGGTNSFVFNQASPATTWTITHNLAYFANVLTVDGTNHEIEGDVRYDSVNQITVIFASAVAGVAYVS